MNMRKQIIIIALVIISACSSQNHEQQLKSYVDDPDNKITQAITVGDVGVVSRFLPASYRSLYKPGNETQTSEVKADNYYYFNVKFNKKVTDKQDKEQLMYLNFDMQKDFTLVTNNSDSIAPAICQKIENGIKGSYEYMLAFEKNDNDQGGFTLLYHDNIFSIGTVAFSYNEKDILKIPGTK